MSRLAEASVSGVLPAMLNQQEAEPALVMQADDSEMVDDMEALVDPQLLGAAPAGEAQLRPNNAPVIRIGKHEALVTAEIGIDIAKAIDTPSFQDWLRAISSEKRLEVSKVHFTSLDFLDARVTHVKLKADVTFGNGTVVPGIVLSRGGFIAVLVILIHEGLRHVLLTRQPQVPVGSSSIPEIPVGLLDGEGRFAGAVATDLMRHCGIQIHRDELIDMTELAHGTEYPGMFASCGGTDEFHRMYLYQAHVSAEELDVMESRFALSAEEGDIIQWQIAPLEALCRISPDGKALAAACLHDRLEAAGQLSTL
jgi:hypothetical protein